LDRTGDEQPPRYLSSWAEAVAMLRRLGMHDEADAIEDKIERHRAEGPPIRLRR
jgi:hypothetical protein